MHMYFVAINKETQERFAQLRQTRNIADSEIANLQRLIAAGATMRPVLRQLKEQEIAILTADRTDVQAAITEILSSLRDAVCDAKDDVSALSDDADLLFFVIDDETKNRFADYVHRSAEAASEIADMNRIIAITDLRPIRRHLNEQARDICEGDRYDLEFAIGCELEKLCDAICDAKAKADL